MITRSKAKMASGSSDSMDFDVNNQLGAPDNGEENSSVEPNMTEETSEVRARGQESQQPQESQQQGEVTLQSLMDFMREVRREQNEKFDQQKEEINQRFDKQNEKLEENKREQNEKLDKMNEKLDNHKEEVKQQMAEQFTQFRTEIREYKNTWNVDGNEVQKKQEEVMIENYEDVRKVQDTDNTCLLYTSRCV